MKKTDFESIRDVATAFLYTSPQPLEIVPMLVSHPFANSAISAIKTEDGFELINILESDGWEKFVKNTEQVLEEVKSLSELFIMLNKTYRFTFLEHIQRFLSNDDLGRVLKFIWTQSEFTNSGDVFTKKQLLRLFKKASPNTLMDKEDLAILQELPDRLTIYRGANSRNSKDPNVFSWTLSRKTAAWYANRFDDSVPCIFQAEIVKEGVLAYWDEGDCEGKELVLNPYMLENIQKAVIESRAG